MTHPIRPRLVPPGTALSRPLVSGHVHLGLVLHGDQGEVPVDRAMLEAMGCTVDEAFAEAFEWLRRSEGGDELHPVDTVPGMYFLTTHDEQTASRMAVLPDRIAPLGGILAAVPGSNQLLCVPVESMDTVDALRVMASAVGAAHGHSGAPVSDQLFWHDGRHWHVVTLERDEAGDVTVLPPSAFFDRMRQIASMEMVRVVGEA
jgi:hypothetical protein